MSKIDLIIITKNNSESLLKCLTSINETCEKHKIDVVVFDNHSNKETVNELLKNTSKYNVFKNINVLPVLLNKEHRLSKLFNEGIKYSFEKRTRTNYIGMINDNFIVNQGYFDTMIEKIKKADCIIEKDFIFFKDSFFDVVKRIDESYITDHDFSNSIKTIANQNKLNIIDSTEETSNEDAMSKLINSINISKKVIYTFTNASLPKLENSDNYEFVCFTTNKSLQAEGWKIFDVEDVVKTLNLKDDLIKYYFKYNPNEFFKSSEFSIWVEDEELFNINEILFNRIIEKMNTNIIFSFESSVRDCLYKYLLDLLNKKFINIELYHQILELYKWFNLRPNSGFASLNVLIRKHNEQKCINAMNKIYNFMAKYNVQNDELFFNLVLFLLKINYSYLYAV